MMTSVISIPLMEKVLSKRNKAHQLCYVIHFDYHHNSFILTIISIKL